VTESAFRNAERAFKNFWRNRKHFGYPNFKNRNSRRSFQVRNLGILDDAVRITGLGWVRLKERGYIPTDATEYGVYATVSEQAGRWFVSILVEDVEPNLPATTGEVIGVDLGLKTLATCSDGTVFENPKALAVGQRKISRLNREMSRRVKGGKNWRKTKSKLQRAHARVGNVRKDALHNVSHELTVGKRPTVLVIEDLNVKGMTSNHSLARAVSDASMGELRRQIEYKGGWYGVRVELADRWYPSSKTCSVCGKVKGALSLSVREFVCDGCGAVIDRDYNAACNLALLERRNTPGLSGELA